VLFASSPGARLCFVAEGAKFADVLDEHFQHAHHAVSLVRRHQARSQPKFLLLRKVPEFANDLANLGWGDLYPGAADVHKLALSAGVFAHLVLHVSLGAGKRNRPVGNRFDLAALVIDVKDDRHLTSWPSQRPANHTDLTGPELDCERPRVPTQPRAAAYVA
jgi:hypothetical protein